MKLEEFSAQYNRRIDQERTCREMVKLKYPDIMKLVLDYAVANCMQECKLIVDGRSFNTYDGCRMWIAIKIKDDPIPNNGDSCSWLGKVSIVVFFKELSELLLADGYTVTTNYDKYISISGW